MKRKIYQELLDWKNKSKGKTSILINGARRVGKSYISKKFAENEYKSYILIDFARISPVLKDIFENESYDLDNFFLLLSTFFNTKLYHRESVIIFDEVQLYPKARQLTKYLVKDNRYDYILTGSLLSIRQNVSDIVIPSEEKQLYLNPFDFEEFLWASGDFQISDFLRDRFTNLKSIGQALHRKIMGEYRKYILIGGMPDAINEYLSSKDFEKVNEVKQNILNLYRNDVAKFAGSNQNKVLSIFDSLPAQLSKKDKKYRLASLNKNARLREYEDSFMWLEDAMISNSCYNNTDPRVGLGLNSDYSTRKMYMADTGLLVSHAFRDVSYEKNYLYHAILFDKLSINEGMIMENAVAQSIRCKTNKLYFYSRNDKENRKNHMEIDFLLSNANGIVPIEVKSSSYRKHSSLDKFITKFSDRIDKAYILYSKDLMIKNDVIHLPIYMAMFL